MRLYFLVKTRTIIVMIFSIFLLWPVFYYDTSTFTGNKDLPQFTYLSCSSANTKTERDTDRAREMSMAALNIFTRPYSPTASSLGPYDFNHHNRFNVSSSKLHSLSPRNSNNRASGLYQIPTHFSKSGNFSWYIRWDFQFNFSVSLHFLHFLLQNFSPSD